MFSVEFIADFFVSKPRFQLFNLKKIVPKDMHVKNLPLEMALHWNKNYIDKIFECLIDIIIVETLLNFGRVLPICELGVGDGAEPAQEQIVEPVCSGYHYYN